MKTVIIIYAIGFILMPIIAIGLNKIFPESIYTKQTLPFTSLDNEKRLGRYCFASFLWPIAIFTIFYDILDYWYLQPKLK